MKPTVQVTIQGCSYSLRSDAPAAEIERVAAFVNDRIAEVTTAGRAIDSQQAAVLALLNVAGSYLQLRDQIEPQQEEVRRRLERLMERVEQICPTANPTLFD